MKANDQEGILVRSPAPDLVSQQVQFVQKYLYSNPSWSFVTTTYEASKPNFVAGKMPLE